MLKNGKNKCPLTDEIVSYIYGEIGGNEFEFETHLAGCMNCTDEFAAVSDARYSVFEWQREEFAHLPTPEIVIPYGSTAVDARDTVGMIAAVRAWLGSLSFPVAVTAAVVLCIGLGLVAFNMLGRQDEQFAGKVVAPAVPQRAESSKVPVGDPNPVVVDKQKETIRTPVPVKAADQARRMTTRSTPVVDRPANSYAVGPNKTIPAPKTPALSAYDDNDDNSLRLADLFEEVGG